MAHSLGAGHLHGLAQGLDQVIRAAAILDKQEKVEFIFIGDGPEKVNLRQQVLNLGINNFTFLDPITKIQIPETLSTADILIVPLKMQLTGAVPSKLYEGMAAGKPIILIAESEAAKIVQDADCGIVIKPGDIDNLAKAISYLATNADARQRLGENGRRVVKEKYDLSKIAYDFGKLLIDTFPPKRK